MAHHSASFSITLRVRLDNRPGSFADLARGIADAGGLLDAIDLVRVSPGGKTRDVSVLATDEAHAQAIVAACDQIDGVDVEHVSDRTFLLHLGGKIAMQSRVPIKTRDDLSMAYTPGVARVCQAIAADPESAWNLTSKHNTVAVVTDGSAVLGLGDIGPAAALPVMEGKAQLFNGFGGINLEDIAAPRCFEIEQRLRASLDIPVFHDDQHGTAVVVLAAFLNALRIVDKRIEEVKVVVTGVGAAGVAVTETLQAAGVRNVIGADSSGTIYRGRAGLTPVKERYAETTNPENFIGSADKALAGADVFIGLSQPGAVSVAGIRSMAANAVVFAMANPMPEVMPDEISGLAAVIATGRSDYPNQINNVLAFPGIFRGALDVRARAITEHMEVAAGRAIASTVGDGEVVKAVAAVVAEAAEEDDVARRPREATDSDLP